MVSTLTLVLVLAPPSTDPPALVQLYHERLKPRPRADGKAGGCVFEAPDGTRFVIAPAATRGEADRRAAAAGPHAKIWAIRPAWSLPAPAWIAADPDFWRTSPAARTKGGER